jgi:hypothetical protein
MPTVPFLLGAAFMLGWDHPAIKPWVGYLERFKIVQRFRRPSPQMAGAKALEAPSSES